MTSRQVTLIGKTGFLGRALECQLSAVGGHWSGVRIADHRAFVSALLQSSAAAQFIRQLGASDAIHDWIFAAGLVDPRSEQTDLEAINLVAPLRLAEQLNNGSHPGRHRLVTFGSVLEHRTALVRGNAYLEGKRRLFETWQGLQANMAITWIHIQLHTLYGGSKSPHPWMFTGQMLTALSTGGRFEMSAGEQIREYHHVDDIAQSVMRYLTTHSEGSQVIELSCGCPIRLRELAQEVFEHFGRRDLLSIGTQPASGGEVYNNEYQPSPHLFAYREPYAGVIAWFEELGVSPT